jgi:hypothetical protein
MRNTGIVEGAERLLERAAMYEFHANNALARNDMEAHDYWARLYHAAKGSDEKPAGWIGTGTCGKPSPCWCGGYDRACSRPPGHRGDCCNGTDK